MTKPREIPAHIRSRQHKASDPEVSIWVSANAGSGKTHVLAQRVLRHLLARVAPGKILCLTFTKAAAANMAARVFKALAEWTEHDDAALAAAIVETGAPPPGPAELTFARRLFAHAVETPGGLKIQTIHAFCERLLHLFPFEANVPGRFEVLDDLAQADLLDRARKQVLDEARNDTGHIGRAYALLTEEISQREFEDLIAASLRHRDVFANTSDAAFALRRALGLAEKASLDSIECQMIEGGIAPPRWRQFASFLAMSAKKSDADTAALFLCAVEAHEAHRHADVFSAEARAQCLAPYLEIFFTKAGEGPPRAKLATSDFDRARPDLAQELRNEQARLDALRDLRRSAETYERSLALTLLMQALFARYQRLKGLRGLLDFDDLIGKTANLLRRSDARWVLYKLDAGIDHILVDEAQDTSEAQWRILEELTGEFAGGEGTPARTFFAVGDEKQSIFSFQGAAPHMFHAMRRRLTASFTQSGIRFDHVQLTDSFRSVPAILGMVDQVFERPAHQQGLVSEDLWMGHNAVKQGLPGLVEIWPALATNAEEAPGDWRLPLDFRSEADPANILARRIAAKIAMLIAPGSSERVADADGRPRAIRPSDILILVRTRNAFFDAMIRALKQNQVPVAGADRLQLTEHIAIMDLMTVGRVARLPDDDLGLACVLKSPLIGFDDNDLLRLAPHRKGSLFAALRASQDARDHAAAAKVRVWQSRAALPPFAFYASLLGADGGRRAFEARLGPEACDALDEFLRLALEAERDGNLTLATFLETFEGIDLEIKRDMETLGDSVRVMTVHAAKGLEAKIVFLPDTCSAPNGQNLPKLFALPSAAGGKEVLVWSPRKDGDPSVVAAARAKALAAASDEYRRLLYVALTRAEERLYISGFYGSREPADTWMNMIEATLQDDFIEESAFWSDTETILRRRSSEGPLAADTPEEAAAPPSVVLPEWLRRHAVLETRPLPPLKPSTALAASEPAFGASFSVAPASALERGRLLHHLLQYLPLVSPAGRRAAAERAIDISAKSLDERERQLIVDEALAVIALPQIAALFAHNARAEVAVAGRLRRTDGKVIEIAGQIDRIAETATEVLVADFKTGAAYAQNAIPQPFVTQMALYAAVLAPLWPDKRLVALLIFTNGPKVVTVPPERLDESLQAIGFSSIFTR